MENQLSGILSRIAKKLTSFSQQTTISYSSGLTSPFLAKNNIINQQQYRQTLTAQPSAHQFNTQKSASAHINNRAFVQKSYGNTNCASQQTSHNIIINKNKNGQHQVPHGQDKHSRIETYHLSQENHSETFSKLKQRNIVLQNDVKALQHTVNMLQKNIEKTNDGKQKKFTKINSTSNQHLHNHKKNQCKVQKVKSCKILPKGNQIKMSKINKNSEVNSSHAKAKKQGENKKTQSRKIMKQQKTKCQKLVKMSMRSGNKVQNKNSSGVSLQNIMHDLPSNKRNKDDHNIYGIATNKSLNAVRNPQNENKILLRCKSTETLNIRQNSTQSSYLNNLREYKNKHKQFKMEKQQKNGMHADESAHSANSSTCYLTSLQCQRTINNNQFDMLQHSYQKQRKSNKKNQMQNINMKTSNNRLKNRFRD